VEAAFDPKVDAASRRRVIALDATVPTMVRRCRSLAAARSRSDEWLP
jgi:hypothetical protein